MSSLAFRLLRTGQLTDAIIKERLSTEIVELGSFGKVMVRPANTVIDESHSIEVTEHYPIQNISDQALVPPFPPKQSYVQEAIERVRVNKERQMNFPQSLKICCKLIASDITFIVD